MIDTISTIKHLMTHTAQFYSRSVDNTWGGNNTDTLLGTANCDFYQLSSAEKQMQTRTEYQATHRILIQTPVYSITREDVCLIDGVEYNIVNVYEPADSNHLQIDLLEQEAE